MDNNKKIKHKEVFEFAWGVFTFLLGNWKIAVSFGTGVMVSAAFAFIFTVILLPIGNKYTYPLVREPVKKYVESYGKRHIKKIDSTHTHDIKFLNSRLDSLNDKFRSN